MIAATAIHFNCCYSVIFIQLYRILDSIWSLTMLYASSITLSTGGAYIMNMILHVCVFVSVCYFLSSSRKCIVYTEANQDNRSIYNYGNVLIMVLFSFKTANFQLFVFILYAICNLLKFSSDSQHNYMHTCAHSYTRIRIISNCSIRSISIPNPPFLLLKCSHTKFTISIALCHPSHITHNSIAFMPHFIW